MRISSIILINAFGYVRTCRNRDLEAKIVFRFKLKFQHKIRSAAFRWRDVFEVHLPKEGWFFKKSPRAEHNYFAELISGWLWMPVLFLKLFTSTNVEAN